MSNTDMIHALAFAPDGKMVASGSSLQDGTLRLWNLKTGQKVRRIETGSCATGLAFSPDGRRLLASLMDGTLRWYDPATGKELRCFQVQAETLQSMALTRDGQRAVTAGGADVKGGNWKPGTDFTMRLWDVVAGKELYRFEGHQFVVSWVTLSPDGRYALSTGDDTTLRLWRLPAPPPRQPPAKIRREP